MIPLTSMISYYFLLSTMDYAILLSLSLSIYIYIYIFFFFFSLFSQVSLILRGANDYMLDEMERALHDALSIVKRTLESNTVNLELTNCSPIMQLPVSESHLHFTEFKKKKRKNSVSWLGLVYLNILGDSNSNCFNLSLFVSFFFFFLQCGGALGGFRKMME